MQNFVLFENQGILLKSIFISGIWTVSFCNVNLDFSENF